MFVAINPDKEGDDVLLIAATDSCFLGMPLDLDLSVLDAGWIILSTEFFCGTIPFPFAGSIIPGRRGEMAFEVVNWVTRGSADGAGAIGTKRVICGMEIGGCIVEIVGIV